MKNRKAKRAIAVEATKCATEGSGTGVTVVVQLSSRDVVVKSVSAVPLTLRKKPKVMGVPKIEKFGFSGLIPLFWLSSNR